jgi:dTDP-4-amino-4,6-dideoxygalactose transaminase
LRDFLVPFNDVTVRSPAERREISRAFEAVLVEGQYFFGEQSNRLELEFAEFVGSEYVIPVGNGTDALEISLRAVGVSKGDVVICVANAGGYSSVAINLVGGVPVYVDVNHDDLQMNPEALESAIARCGSKPKALVITHLYGAVGQVEKIVEICRAHNIAVVEDCAQAIGVRKDGKHAGTFGDVGTFSFYPTKNLGGVGDSGAVVTSSSTLAKKVRALAQYGWTKKYTSSVPFGRNSRMDEIQAAVLRIRLRKIDRENTSRLKIFRRYLGVSNRLDFVHRDHPDFNSHLAVLRVNFRPEVKNRLLALGVETAVHYPLLDSQQDVFGGKSMGTAVAMNNSPRIISIPCHPGLSAGQVDLVCEGLDHILDL